MCLNVVIEDTKFAKKKKIQEKYIFGTFLACTLIATRNLSEARNLLPPR